MRTITRTVLLAAMLMMMGCQQSQFITEQFTGKTAVWAAKKLQDPDFPDERREGINYLIDHDYGKLPVYTKAYQAMAQYDRDYTVRAAAIRALNRARDQSATGVFIKALGDANDLVRLEACKALVNIPDPAAAEPLGKIVGNQLDNKDVRIAAADALKHYRNVGVARTLVTVLNGRDFGVAWQARHSLVWITGRDLRYDEVAWLNLLTTGEKPLG